MKRTLLICISLLVIIVGGVYLAQRGASSIQTTTDTGASSSQAAGTDTASGSSASTTKPVPQSGSITLALGESATFHGVVITPTKVVEDSRCPAGVYCIQAGTLRLEVSAKTLLGTVTRTVKLGDSVTIGSQKFTFSGVSPLKTQKPIDPKDYRFTVTVEKI